MLKAVREIDSSDDEDSGEIVDIDVNYTQWETMDAIRHPMPKDTLWGSELILGTILDSKKSTSFEKLNFCPTDKVLYSQTPPLPPPPPPPPSPISATPLKTLSVLLPSMISKESPEEKLHKSLLKEIEEKLIEVDEKDSRLRYSSNLTEGTMFDIVEKPVRTTVEHFQHEWSVSINDYSTMRLKKLQKDLNLGDNECSELTSGTYLETVIEPSVSTEMKNLWNDPAAPASRTQSDISCNSGAT